MRFSPDVQTFRSRTRALFCASFFVSASLLVAGNTWDGGGTTNNWSDNANWNPDGQPGYGTISFSGSNRTTNTMDQSYNMNQINWNGSSAWVMNSSNNAVLNLFDNGGTQAKVESLGTGGVTINAPITFAATTGNNWGEINSVSSSITFASGTLTVNGSGVNGIRMFGGSTGISTTFNNTVSASGKYFSTSAVGQTVNIGGSFTSGDFYLMNSGTLNLNSGGSFTTSALRLGGDFGTTGTQDQTKGATFNLAATGGGQTFSGTINSVSGNTSGALTINSQNTSGANTLSGGIFLDSNLSINQAAGGSLTVSGSIDLKNQTLAVGSAGSTTISGTVSNSTGTGSISKSGAGMLTLSNANTYSGSTSVSAGVLRVTNTSGSATGSSSVVVTNSGSYLAGGTTNGTGGISGAVSINPSANLSPGTSGNGSGSTAILNTGALTLVSASNFVLDLNSTTAGTGYDQVRVSGTVNVSGSNLSITAGTGLSVGDKFFITLNDGTDLVTGTFAQGATAIATNNGDVFAINYVDNGDGGTVGNDISLTLVAIPEPSTWIAGILSVGALAYSQRRRFVRARRLA